MNFITQALKIFFLSLKAGLQGIYGIYRLSRLKQPIVTIFGGSRAYEGGKYSEWAQEAAYLCASHDLSVVTGGGPGIMHAASRGAYGFEKNKNWVLGIGVSGVNPEFENKYAPRITVSYFFIRKWLLMRYSCGFILFPGGIGTADEFFELLNQMNLARMKKVPIVLVGRSYWNYLIEWYRHAYERELIPLAPEDIFVVTDDPKEAVELIRRSCISQSSQ